MKAAFKEILKKFLEVQVKIVNFFWFLLDKTINAVYDILEMKILARPALRKERLKRNWALRDPAYYARVTPMQLSLIERQKRNVTSQMADRLCRHYKMSFFDLFEIVEDKKLNQPETRNESSQLTRKT